MTQTDLEHAQKAMQQQWYDLVMAEQQGSTLDVLEHMYDTYILLAEEYNRCCEASHKENQPALRTTSTQNRTKTRTTSSNEDQNHIKLAS
ncbi:MAG TPA: hypothetical protein VE843_03770 [Ktedonobacteraceae bacterium]|nr:hypothetical protein [Ktedonobacteraceae bacterium]